MLIPAAITIGLCALPSFVAGTNAAGLAFLEENKQRPGVVTLASGLQYKVLVNGSGEFYPWVHSFANTSVLSHYAGTTAALTPNFRDMDEKMWKAIASSFKKGKPVWFSTGYPNPGSEKMTIKGMQGAMELMVEGDKWELYIPSELAFGEIQSHSKVKAGDVVIYRLEILNISGQMIPKENKKIPIEEISQCDWEQPDVNCTAQERKYLKKQQAKTPEGRKAEEVRLTEAWKAELTEDQNVDKALFDTGLTEKQMWIFARYRLVYMLTIRDDTLKMLASDNVRVKQEQFVKKMEKLTMDKQRVERQRLEGMLREKRSDEEKDWVRWRINWVKRAHGQVVKEDELSQLEKDQLEKDRLISYTDQLEGGLLIDDKDEHNDERDEL